MYLLENISIAFHNVDSIHKKIGGQSFCKLDCNNYRELLKKHDIIFLAETHCGQSDSLSLPGYQIKQNQRQKTPGAPKTFGGLAICVKDTIKKGVHFIPPTNTEISWIKLCKSFFDLEKDIFMAVVYAAPASSYAPLNVDVFETLENDLALYNSLGSCFLCGDFNGRTATENDYCLNDNFFSVSSSDGYVLDRAIQRNNVDPHLPDSHGKKLLSLCKATGMRILNGRTFGDYFGQCTCYSHNGSPSVIDYMLADNELLNKIECFHVNNPSDMSIHTVLSCAIKLNAAIHVQTRATEQGDDEFVPEYQWKDGDDQRFIEALCDPAASKQLSEYQSKLDPMTCDEAVDGLTKIIMDSSKRANIKQKRKNKNNYSAVRPGKAKKKFAWFDSECRNVRHLFRKSCAQIRRNPFDRCLQQEFKLLRNRYKKLLNKKKRSHTRNFLKELENLEDRNPTAFWKLFNKMKPKTKNLNDQISTEDWVNMFSSQMNGDSSIDPMRLSSMNDYVKENANSIFNSLNFSISKDEISSAIRNLKRGKACGPDLVLNEMLKAGKDILLPLLHKVFNKILLNYDFPTSWRTNFLTPLHKKGDTSDPTNYRGIAVGSHLGKLFCSILHNRLVKFCTEKNTIPNNQIGFKKGSRPTDHILTLKTLIEKYATGSKRYLYSCFVDFKSAFDTVPRDALMYKLLRADIGGSFLKTIQSLYKPEGVKFSVKTNRASKPFSSSIGVKQGCILSPLLFNLYTRDIPDIFNESCDPVALNGTILNCLMYADDLVLLSQSAKGLQNCLNSLEAFCKEWGLRINIQKTKVMIFNKSGQKIKKYNFSILHEELTIADSYCYLGILFTISGNFKLACERLCDQASKAIFRLKQLDVKGNITVALKLFNCLIRPILLYGSEVWGPYYSLGLSEENLISKCDALPAEKIFIKFCRYLLGVRRNSPTQAVRGELGQLGLLTTILPISVKYWFSICERDCSALVKQAYLTSLSFQSSKGWASHIGHILRSNQLEETWSNQGSLFKGRDSKLLKKSIQAKFTSSWLKLLPGEPQTNGQASRSKLRSYALFKTSLNTENYLLDASNIDRRREFTRLRISAHKLRIETGRHTRTPVEARLCTQCNQQEIEDERHFILACTKYNDQRNKLVQKLNDFTSFNQMSDDDKFVFLMGYNEGDIEIFKIVSDFISECFLLRT